MMEAKNLHYSMIIQWEPLDKIYVVTVPELEGCVTHGKTYEEAVAQGQEAIEAWVMGEDVATLPAPDYYPLDDEDGRQAPATEAAPASDTR
jgi:predicted RNase H-like HicB family nuclease